MIKMLTLSAFSVILSLSSSMPTLAQQQTIVEQQQNSQTRTIPQSTAIVVAFPHPIEFDVGQEQPYSTTVPLAQPILDSQGDIAVPANSLVTVKLVPSNGGAQIVAESIVIAGQVVPIKASGSTIAGQEITLTKGPQKAGKNAPTYTRLGSNIVGAIGGGDLDSVVLGQMVGQGVGIIVDLSSPETINLLTIPPGSVYVLTLEAPIVSSGRGSL
ncbi:hypothetical protein [Okeania sp. SIO2B3]|uniref:hypothetical protein n=1 Tax=Okeania sp. SIO2B3 TaxID=2607784 RepID=UPI0013C02A28|nr:hypothetical protein [Okeania sp. SIO2B3]NET45924.1 hypothetical protein [Okeania sp. SIO2B3]